MFKSIVLEDSINPKGVRLTTLQVTFPREVLAEFNTHRMFSRNSASSRAIPARIMRAEMLSHTYYPAFGANQRGMAADKELGPGRKRMSKAVWWLMSRCAAFFHWMLEKIGAHKQVANRLLEPFMWHTVIVSATDWENFLGLRLNKNAHPAMYRLAELIRDSLHNNVPTQLEAGQWHLPLIGEDRNNPYAPAIAAGRCARVTYNAHLKKRTIEEDMQFAEQLINRGHFSPAEHCALAEDSVEYVGNFRGFTQLRKHQFNEADRLDGWRLL